MINVGAEALLSLNAAARIMPAGRNGSACSLGAVLRWVLCGSRSPSGELVRLEAIRMGGRWLTSREALQRFAERLTPSLDGEAAPTPRTTRQRQRAAERATKKLESMGV